MQLNNTELRLIEGVIPTQSLPTFFQLPGLHEDVSRTAIVVRYETDFSALGRGLIEAEIINLDDIPDTVTSSQQVVAEGLRAWFMRRIGGLEHMRFDVEIFDAEAANAHIDNPQFEGAPFTGPTFAIRGSEAQLRYVEDVARAVEKEVPGLFLTAYTELISASYRTVEIQHPERILENETSYSLWGNDIHSVQDEEAREALIERYGDDSETSIDYYMPDAILEAYGNGFCFDMSTATRSRQGKKKQPRFSNRRLRKLARQGSKKVAAIAKGLLALRRASHRVQKLDARFKGPDGMRCYWVACLLLFNNDDRVTHFMDQEGQYLWENGEGTDLHAIEQLPETASDLATYFEKLDALFDLVIQMDALIPNLSYCAYAE